MKFLRLPLLAGSVLCLLCACAAGPSTHERKEMGDIQIVYLQPGADLMVLDRSIDVTDSFSCFGFAGALGVGLCAIVLSSQEDDRESALNQQNQHLAPYLQEIKSLDFQARSHALFTSVVADTPWLAGKPIQTVPWMQDEQEYVRGQGGTTVLYVQPIYAMDPFSNAFVVHFFVGIERFEAADGGTVHSFRREDFSFQHQPIEPAPGMDHRQRAASANAAIHMDRDQAMRIWFADGGALLKADVDKDLQQVDQDIRKLLGSSHP
jgi:hypothetical protein